MQWILLDRDGVINHERDDYIKSPEEWVPLPGSVEAIARLSAANYHIAIATNQSGIARGLYTLDDLHAVHDRLHETVNALGGRVDAIYFCPHREEDACVCRTPKPGMLKAIAKDYHIDLQSVQFVGDSLRDLQAAHAVGAQGVLVKTGYGEKTLTEGFVKQDIPIYDDLAAYVDDILRCRE